jgi:hypothetical protein
MMCGSPVDVVDCPWRLSRRLTRTEEELNDHASALLDRASGLLAFFFNASQRMVLTDPLLDRASGLLDLASGICQTGEQIADFDDLAGTDHNRTIVEQAEDARGRAL